jgi:hypothetical protein
MKRCSFPCCLQETSEPTPRSPFDGIRVPQISLRDYIYRISRYSKCSNVCFCMAFSYLQRLAQVQLHFQFPTLPRGQHASFKRSCIISFAKAADSPHHCVSFCRRTPSIS